MQITNGTVEYERAVKPADYEKRGAKLVLSFAVEEGSDAHAVVAKVFDMAVAEVHHRIGLNGPAYVRRMAETDTAKVEMQTAPPEFTAKVEKLAPIDYAKAAAEAAAKREAAAAPQSNPTVPATSRQEDAGVSSDATRSVSSAPGVSSPDDPLAIVAPTTAPASDKPVEITDSDLHAAVHQALERKATALQVRNLTDEFTGVVGQSMRTLPQDKRAAFVAALKELKPE